MEPSQFETDEALRTLLGI